MRSVMAHSFSQVPRADIPRSTFNRSHGYKTTFDADYLYGTKKKNESRNKFPSHDLMGPKLHLMQTI